MSLYFLLLLILKNRERYVSCIVVKVEISCLAIVLMTHLTATVMNCEQALQALRNSYCVSKAKMVDNKIKSVTF